MQSHLSNILFTVSKYIMMVYYEISVAEKKPNNIQRMINTCHKNFEKIIVPP